MKTTNQKFEVGQRVKQYDAEDGCNVYGHVVEVRERSILVKWNDLSDPCEHFEDEYDTIKNGVPAS